MTIYKFTPDLQNPEELKKLFVGREKLLKDILGKIEKATITGTSKNCILIGPRGIGKTHLLLLIYYSINESKLKNHLIPIKFAEEEYSIFDLADLILKILEHMNEEVDIPTSEFIEALKKKDKTEILENSLEFIRKFKIEKNKRLLLLLENLQLIFDQFGNEDISRFRDILQREDFFMIIGTAPTFFDKIAKYEEPFYNFFETIYLNKLSPEDIEELIKKRAEYEESDVLKNFEDFRPRIRAISILTGGNPRLLLMLYQIITENRFMEVRDSLLKLLDEMTPFFQAQMESLPAQQRKILDTLALMDGPATPTEIAKTSRTKVNIVTSQLKRLEDAGYVTPKKYKKKKIVRYEVRERLFRIWREMRTPLGKKRISLLVKFLEIWYTPKELILEYKRIEENIDEVFKLGRVEEAKKSLKYLCYIHEAVSLRFKHDIREKLIDKFLEVGDMQGAKEEIKRIELQAKKEKDPKKLFIFFTDIISFYMKINDNKKVLETVEKLLKITPEKSNICGFCGNVLKKLGRYDEALKSINRAIELDPTSYFAYHEKGNVLWELGKPKEALECFDKAIELDPTSHFAYHEKSNVLWKLDKPKEALECFDKAIELDPDCVSCLAARSRVLAGLNKEKEALESINRAIELDPTSHFVYHEKGNVLWGFGKPKEALKCFDKAIELDPDCASCWVVRGRVLADLNKEKEALESFNRAIELDPTSHFAYHEKGNVLWGFGKPKEALKCFDKAIELDPDCASCWVVRGRVLADLNKEKEALESINRAIELDPTSHLAYHEKGYVLLELDKPKEALKCFDKAIEIGPDCASCWAVRGRVLADFNKEKEALESINRAIELDPKNSAAKCYYGRTLLRLRKYREALKYFEEAITLDIECECPSIWAEYGRSLASIKKYEDALKSVERAIEISREKDDVETLNEMTNLFVGIALKQSRYYLKKENFNQALESLKKSLRFSKERERKGELDRKLEKVFIKYLKKIASTKNYEFTEKALTIIIETLDDNYKELLMPFSKAIEYLITKNTEILDTLQQEVRDAVIEIIGDISDIKID